MTILFISDLHLSEKNNTIVSNFKHFLRNRAIFSESIYILGDLFDFWIGDDNLYALHYEIANILRELKKIGVSCYFIGGNRDFLVGEKYASLGEMILLGERAIIEFGEHRIIVLHGDTLFLEDRFYQFFRKRSRKFKKFFLEFPLSVRIRIAKILRYFSNIKNKKVHHIQVDSSLVISILRSLRANMMIHGHIHRSEICFYGNEYKRISLGSWETIGSVVEVDERGVTLLEFPIF